MSLRDRINRRYVSERGIGSGIDVRMRDADVYKFVAVKATQRARGVVRRLPGAFIASDVRLLNRRHLTVGGGVSIGRGVLIDALSVNGVVVEDAATIDVGAVIRGSGGVRRLGVGVHVGERAAIGASNFIHGGGGVVIGRDVLLGPYVQIFSENHVFDDPDVAIIEQGETPAAVSIGDGSWIGASSIVLAGVNIGRAAVVAAGSVVTTDVPPYTVAAGVPAKVVRMRNAPTSGPTSRSTVEEQDA